MSKDIFYTELEEFVRKGNTRRLLLLLKETPLEERLKYTKKISKLGKYYQEYVPEEGNRNSYGYRRNSEQRSAVSVAVLACCTYKDFTGIWIISEEEFKQVLDWYVPDWLGDYINDSAREGWVRAPFNEIGYLYESYKKGVFKTPLTEATWATVMVNASKVELFDQYPELLEKEFWYLFDHEVNINHYSWDEVIATLIEQGRLDKQRIVQTVIQGALTHTNQALCGWNVNLLSKLSLADHEILSFQEDIFQLLNSPLSKVVNEALDILFKIAKDKAFHVEAFVNSLPILMSSTVKATINKAMRIVAVLDKAHPTYKEASAVAIVGALHIQDQAMQTKVAKQIVKYAQPNEELAVQLEAYQEMMMSETKTLFSGYMSVQESVTLAEAVVEGEAELVPIQAIATVEDLIFHCSAWKTLESDYAYEQTIDAIIRLQGELKAEHIDQLLPAFDKVFKTFKDLWSTSTIQNAMAFWLLEWARMLIADPTIETTALDKLYHKYANAEIYTNSGITLGEVKLEASNRFSYYYAALRPYLTVYYYSLQLVKEKRIFPILSLPTHEPFYIDSRVLVDRLVAYQKEGELVDAVDLQIALARIDKNTEEAGLTLAQQQLKGELLAIFEFYLGNGEVKEESADYYDIWRVAAALKYPHQPLESLTNERYTKEQQEYCAGWLGNWEVIEESHTYKDWDHKTKTQIDKVFTHKKLKFEQIPYDINLSLIFSRINKAMPKTEVGDRMGSANLMGLIMYQIRDTKVNLSESLLAINPRQLDPIYLAVVEKCLHYGGSATFEVAEKKLLQGMFTYLLQMNNVVFSEQFYLFFGLALICDDKVTRAFVAEYWIKEALRLDQQKVGHIIGKVEAKEYVTIKRLTDSIQGFMMNVSVQHNQALQLFIESILEQLGASPIKGLKTLLEQYVEVLHTNNAKVTNPTVIALIEEWSKVSATKKIAVTLRGQFA
ncbi:DUF6493 family protein [Myroides odoratimimus]|uniref:DUF6493 family protein n=1 Tax=Myroides odoratimimus TaxID=76832 RepID=UPI002DB56226|nr:DUF6493 family protein [Myroides odoratimimus]MEC4042117.1 DUF6493 family protein [Myroides odoratimimus]MEC4149942.1 DUF6493 family protein [Myroides odoratimimus]